MKEYKEKKSGGTPHYEDIAMKTAVHVFGKELLPRLGIKGKLEAIMPTESISMEVLRTYSDFNYSDESDGITHIEFASSNPGLDGLKKNRIREAILSQQLKKEVTTYVIYSGNVKKPITEFTEGVNTYRIVPIIMKKDNADELFKKLDKKTSQGNNITKSDILSVLLTPLMAGESSQYERISKAIKIVKEHEKQLLESKQYEAVLFAFANKFLEDDELNKIKEELAMTRVGEFLFNEGRKEERKEAQIRTIKNMLKKEMDFELIAEIAETSVQFVEEISGSLEKV